jgi:hypothetical protein
MISSFTVGSVFKIIDEASPALRVILAEVRKLNVALDQARANLAAMGKFAAPAGLTAAVTETGELAAAWKLVAANATAAQRAIGAASSTAVRSAPAAAAAATGGGGGRHRPGWLGGGGGGGGGGAHFRGPSVGMPGGGHFRPGGGAAMAGAGLLGYGVYEAAEMEDAVFQLIYHSGLEQNDANRAKFRKIIQDSMVESGYGLKDIAKSAKQEIRMFQGTPGGGLDVLPEMLRAATIEARLKDSSPEESMRSLIGLAHMTKQYSPEAIKKLAPAFAFLSTADPRSLSSIERAAGYAVPLLQSGLEIDPMESLLLGTALARAGATNTKSGTWLREMAVRAMPGTSMMSKMAFHKHEAALKRMGLVDDQDKPTWFTDGKPDLEKMLSIAGPRAAQIPVAERAGLERQLFGAQGGGAFALLADPAVNAQVKALRQTMDSPEFKNRYAGFTEAYKEGSTVQQARTGMAEFNVTMMDIAKITLPAVNNSLGGFKTMLEGIRSVLPGGSGKSAAVVGGHAILGGLAGAGAGALIGLAGGPVGALGGAVIGAVGGGVEGIAEQYMEQQAAEAAKARKEGGRAYERYQDNLLNQVPGYGMGPGAAAPPPKVTLAPSLSIQLNIDGQMLAHAVTDVMGNNTGFVTQAPAADGSSLHSSGDHNFGDR